MFVLESGRGRRREKKGMVLRSDGVKRRFGGKDVFEGEEAFAMELRPECGILLPDERREDALFHFGQMLDQRTDALQIFACLEEDLDDLQEGVGVKGVDLEDPLVVVLLVAVNEENQEKGEGEQRLEEFHVVEELLSRLTKSVDCRSSVRVGVGMFLLFDEKDLLQGGGEEFHRQLEVPFGEVDQRFLSRRPATERSQTRIFHLVDRLPLRQQTLHVFYNEDRQTVGEQGERGDEPKQVSLSISCRMVVRGSADEGSMSEWNCSIRCLVCESGVRCSLIFDVVVCGDEEEEEDEANSWWAAVSGVWFSRWISDLFSLSEEISSINSSA